MGGTGPVVNVEDWSRVQLQLHSSLVAGTNLENSILPPVKTPFPDQAMELEVVVAFLGSLENTFLRD